MAAPVSSPDARAHGWRARRPTLEERKRGPRQDLAGRDRPGLGRAELASPPEEESRPGGRAHGSVAGRTRAWVESVMADAGREEEGGATGFSRVRPIVAGPNWADLASLPEEEARPGATTGSCRSRRMRSPPCVDLGQMHC